MIPYTDILVRTIDENATINHTYVIYTQFRTKLRIVQPRTTWQTYVEHLMASKCLEKAAIFFIDGQVQCLAETDNSNITTKEAMDLVKSMNKDSTYYDPRLEDTRYMRLRVDTDFCCGMKGAGGFYSHKTKLLLLIVIYGRDHQPGMACSAVEKLAHYLMEVGY